jgi:hypothetical protein
MGFLRGRGTRPETHNLLAPAVLSERVTGGVATLIPVWLMRGFWWWDRFVRPRRADFSRPRTKSEWMLGRRKSALPGESIQRKHQLLPISLPDLRWRTRWFTRPGVRRCYLWVTSPPPPNPPAARSGLRDRLPWVTDPLRFGYKPATFRLQNPTLWVTGPATFRLQARYVSVTESLRFGYGIATFRLRNRYVSVTESLRFGYGFCPRFFPKCMTLGDL